MRRVQARSIVANLAKCYLDGARGGTFENEILSTAAALDDLCMTTTSTMQEFVETTNLLGSLVLVTDYHACAKCELYVILHRRARAYLQ